MKRITFRVWKDLDLSAPRPAPLRTAAEIALGRRAIEPEVVTVREVVVERPRPSLIAAALVLTSAMTYIAAVGLRPVPETACSACPRSMGFTSWGDNLNFRLYRARRAHAL